MSFKPSASMPAKDPAFNDSALSEQQFVLLCGSVFIIAACSLVYELLISSLSTYLYGSSVVHYSLTIGLFLFFMGLGAWLAQSVERQLVARFVQIEIAIGAVGGICALILLAVYAWTEYYYPAMLVVIAIIGVLVGMELPLLTRILERHKGLRRGISLALSFDYLGALVASLLFPFILLPYLGHLLTAVCVGLVNLLVALLVAWSFRHQLGSARGGVLAGAIGSVFMLVVAAVWANPAAALFERALYEDPVIHSEQSHYQKLVVTHRGDDLRLFLDGNLQFSSIDEYRYHEVLVHLPASFAAHRKRVLLIGGGDGLAARELLLYPNLESLTVVDLDPAVTNLARRLPKLATLNQRSMEDPRVTTVNRDAWQWLAVAGDLYDMVIVDLPDPESEAIARLYTVAFYQRVARRLAVGGVVITQATSPWFARRAYWSIHLTMQQVFGFVRPAQVYVPSFGQWGFVLAAQHSLATPLHAPHAGRYFDSGTLSRVLAVPRDLQPVQVRVNDSRSLAILQYYREGWESLNLATEPEIPKPD